MIGFIVCVVMLVVGVVLMIFDRDWETINPIILSTP